MTVVFVLGSRVRHVGVALRDGAWLITWGPLCRQLRPSMLLPPVDGKRRVWRIAATPAQQGRPVCSHCVREATKIAEAVR